MGFRLSGGDFFFFFLPAQYLSGAPHLRPSCGACGLTMPLAPGVDAWKWLEYEWACDSSLANVRTRNVPGANNKKGAFSPTAKLVSTIPELLWSLLPSQTQEGRSQLLINRAKIRRLCSGNTVWAWAHCTFLTQQFSKVLVSGLLYTLKNCWGLQRNVICIISISVYCIQKLKLKRTFKIFLIHLKITNPL